ncbi:hypothetical protein GCM10009745_77950 [Kribbella yunnanensis]|uniref:SRPBCC family protein n=1 Tax=Kribbella yunnanensis TaxID=190194 RepID=A0ABP4V4S5_9ACTN
MAAEVGTELVLQPAAWPELAAWRGTVAWPTTVAVSGVVAQMRAGAEATVRVVGGRADAGTAEAGRVVGWLILGGSWTRTLRGMTRGVGGGRVRGFGGVWGLTTGLTRRRLLGMASRRMKVRSRTVLLVRPSIRGVTG